MNKAFKIIYAAVCALPLAMKPFSGSNAEVEKKKLADRPSVVEDGKINNDFSTQFEAWFNDRLPLRSELLSAAGFVKGEILSSPSSNVISGSDGWLFFNDEKKDYMDTNAMTASQTRAAAVTLSLIEERVRSTGGRFTFVPMPNKASVYGEYMPKCYTRAEENNYTRLCRELDDLGVNYVDMLEIMTDQKDLGLYHKRDTHWNYLGALIGYNEIMNSLGAVHENYDGVTFSYLKTWESDLDKLLYPTGGFTDYQYYFDIAYNQFMFTYPSAAADPAEQLAVFMSDKEENDMNITSRSSTQMPNERLYMVRDSFGRALLPFMIDNYKTATFVRTNCPDIGKAQGADMVYEIVERNLKNVISTAPFMFAPERTEAEASASSECELCESVCKNEGYAIKICGTFPEDACTGDGRVYVKLEGQGVSRVFEAFPICESELFGDDCTKGFSMYIDPSLGLDGEFEMTVFNGDTAYKAGKINTSKQ